MLHTLTIAVDDDTGVVVVVSLAPGLKTAEAVEPRRVIKAAGTDAVDLELLPPVHHPTSTEAFQQGIGRRHRGQRANRVLGDLRQVTFCARPSSSKHGAFLVRRAGQTL